MSSPFRPSLGPVFVLSATLALGGAAGCTPQIGDDCSTSLDCSTQGDRLCDTTQPGGYCTIFNCEPDTCPEDEASCVAFNNELDPACGSVDDGEWARFERSFCMQKCDDDEDCRSGYECVNPSQHNAVIVDPDRSFKVCLAVATPPAETVGPPPDVCHPADADAVLTPYEPGAGGAGGGA